MEWWCFQFPVGIRWCSDHIRRVEKKRVSGYFQFPVGIRWCSDMRRLDENG